MIGGGVANRTVSVALVADVGRYVSGMTTAAAATKGLGESVDTTTKKSTTGFDMAGKGALLLGGAVVAGMGLAISKSMEFEKAMSGVQASTMESASGMDSLREAIMRAGADSQYSATEAAEAVTAMAKAGVSAADIMSGGLTGALDLAASGQMDVAEAAEIASVAMVQFNLAGEDLPHVADLLAAGAGKAMGSVEDLGAALNQSGLIAAAAGLSIEETTGGLAAFASAGLVGSDAGTSFKTMLQALQAPSGKSAELMNELGINMYDANGNMLGLSEMAGVLQARLGDLTQEQRNAALAQIFGTDAVRAANVLYKEGAVGIEQWTSRVNDAGYAQRQAAMLTDNLAGDLERLGGAFDTLMISLGGSTDGILRGFVQGLTGVLDAVNWAIDAFDSLPGPVQAAIGVLGALLLINGPLSGALSATGAAISAFTTRLAAATTTTAGFSAASSGLLAALGGPVGLAIGASTVAIGYMVKGLVNMGEATVDTAGYQEQLANALVASKGAIDDNVRALAAQRAAETDITDNTSLLDYAQQAGVDLGLMTDALLGNRDAAEQVTAQLDDYLQVQAAAALARGEDAGTVAAWTEQNNIAKDAISQMIPVLGDAQVKNSQLAEATAESGGAMEIAAEQTRDFKQEASDAKEAVDALKAGLDALTGATVTQFEAEAQLQDAITKADGALEDMTGSVLDADGKLNAYSESGREAGDVLLEVRDKGNQLISTLQAQGATEDEVRAKDAELRQSFINTANQMGITGGDAERLADQILGIPAERETRIYADTSNATRTVEDFIAKVTGKTVTLTGDYTSRPGVVVRKAQGGFITGPGTATSDSVPALLSNGEYVVNAKATSYNRDLLEAINSGQIAKFASGGLVDAYTVKVDITKPTQAQIAAATGGTAGSGAVGGAWTSLWNLVKSQIPQARINSTFRPGDPGYHGRNKAIDFGFGSGPGGLGSAGLASINRLLHDQVGGNLAELIYNGVGDDRNNIKNGRPLAYSASTQAAHRDHVHAAVYHDGTDFVPQTGWAYLERGEAVIPAETNARSREFSGSAGMRSEPIDYSRMASEIAKQLDGRPAQAVHLYTPDIPQAVRALESHQRLQAALAPAW